MGAEKNKGGRGAAAKKVTKPHAGSVTGKAARGPGRSNDPSLASAALRTGSAHPFNQDKLVEVLQVQKDDPQHVPAPISEGGDAPKGAATYEHRYVAFMDILGFSDIISKSKDPSSDLPAKIYNALDIQLETLECGAHKLFEGAAGADLRVHSFSDCVVISSASTPVGLASMLFACWRVASDWLEQGFLCRGGISRGSVTHHVDGEQYYDSGGSSGDFCEVPGRKSKSTLVFGPAFVEAHHLESKVADFSRIVLSREVREEFVKNSATGGFGKFKTLVKKSGDGPYCLDIFAHIRKKTNFDLAGSDHQNSVTSYARVLALQHDDTSDTPHFYRKVKWLVDEFNEAIRDTKYADQRVEHT